MAGINLQDSNRLTISTGSPQKDGAVFMAGESMEAETIQFPQATCMAQSDESIGCMVEAERFAESNEATNITTTATEILFFLANRRTFFNKLKKRINIP